MRGDAQRAKILAEIARWASVLNCVEGPWESIGNGPVKSEELEERDLTGEGESDRLASGEGHVENQAPC